MNVQGSSGNNGTDGMYYYSSDTDSNSMDLVQLLSPASNSYRELFSKACQYIKENKHYEILVMIPDILQFPVLPPVMHLLFGCTLFRLGRIGGALREVSLAIEMETDQTRKDSSIKTLTGLFKQLGMKEQATACFSELLFTSSINPDDKNTTLYERQLAHLILDPMEKRYAVHVDSSSLRWY